MSGRHLSSCIKDDVLISYHVFIPWCGGGTLQSPSWLPVVTHMSVGLGGLWRSSCRLFIHASSSGILRLIKVSLFELKGFLKTQTVMDSRFHASPVGGRVLQRPLHRRLVEGERRPVLQLDGCGLEGEGVGVGRSAGQRDQGRRRPQLQLG